MEITKLKEMQGSTDLGIIGKKKRGKDKRSNDGRKLDAFTIKNDNENSHSLANSNVNAGQEGSIVMGESMKKKREKHMKGNYLRLLEKTSDGIMMNNSSKFVPVELSKDYNQDTVVHRKKEDMKEKYNTHSEFEKLASVARLCDEKMHLSENPTIDGVKESRKHNEKQKNEKKQRKSIEIIDISSFKNASVDGEASFEDEIDHGDPMRSEKGQKKRRKNNKDREYFKICADSCNWHEIEVPDEKRKRKDIFLVKDQNKQKKIKGNGVCNRDEVSDQNKKRKGGILQEEEHGKGSSKKMTKEAAVKAFNIIFEGDDEEVPPRTHVRKKAKKFKKEDNVGDCPKLTLEMTSRKEKGDQQRIVITNHVEKNKSDLTTPNVEKGSCDNESFTHEQKKDAKKCKKHVSFANEVEEFSVPQITGDDLDSENIVGSKWYTPEEDELLKKAVMNYIEEKQLGEQGLHMILNCKLYKEVLNCWRDISASMPWRRPTSVYYRVHTLYERSKERKWLPEELELLKRYYAEYGPKWKKLADILGKNRFHTRDAWRRTRFPNRKKGFWSPDECQSLCDLVNLDLRMKAFQQKTDDHRIRKDNISWEAISNKMTTRTSQSCCVKWYYSLSSPMVQEGKWDNVDDYKLIDALQKSNACCYEEVDWNNLLENRSGELCQKRWHSMLRHLDNFWAMPFSELVNQLARRYSPDMIPYRELDLNKTK